MEHLFDVMPAHPDKQVCPICRRPIDAGSKNAKNSKNAKTQGNTSKAADPSNATSPHHPFCSPRCRRIDLAAWLDGRYSIPDADPAAFISGDESDVDS